MNDFPDYAAMARDNMAQAERLVAWLKVHGVEVGDRATEGDQAALHVINLTGFLHRHVDSGSVGLLTGAIHDYCKKHEIARPEEEESW